MENPKWLSSVVFYQVYPQSFYDSNGDGIGDINGITAKLDYIKSLGCDAIWLNPCFVSPFGDAGYDIADFYRVAPRYGTNADLARLFREVHRREMKVVLDFVPGHTSIEHPWFKESCKEKKNKYSNRYIWTDSVWHFSDNTVKTVPGYSQRNGNFATNFFWFQPALNYGFAVPDPAKPWQLSVNHPDVLAVRKEMIKIMRFWLDMGADGFRVDCAYSLVKGDSSRYYTGQVWQEVRQLFDKNYPNAALIAEWFFPAQAINSGFHVDFMANGHGEQPEAYSSLFRKESLRNYWSSGGHSFFDRQGKGNIREFLDVYLYHYNSTRGKGYISIFSGNHDSARVSIGRDQKDLELIFAFLLTMPGVPYIYYGDEIGMRYCPLSSKEGGYQRTGSRTPMQWNSQKNAGFSDASPDKLYLPIDLRPTRPTVEKQLNNPKSLLNRVKALIDFRKAHTELCADGEFISIYAEAYKYPFIYMRMNGNDRMLVALNPSNAKVKTVLNLPHSVSAIDIEMGRGDVRVKLKKHRYSVEMGPVSYAVARVK